MNTPTSLLTHREVTLGIRSALLANSWAFQDVDDGIQDVRVKLLAAFERGTAVPPDLEGMKAFANAVATNHAIDARRHAWSPIANTFKRRYRGAHAPLPWRPRGREPVDAGRQLEVLAELFRERAMPEDGLDILDGVGSGYSVAEVAEELGISEKAVRFRLAKMRRIFKKRMLERGLWPGIDYLRLVVSSTCSADEASPGRRTA